MFKRRFRLPSPALVISMITLSLVLGGTAFAAAATKGDTKADTKLIKKLAPTLSVKHAKSADSATNATNASHATSADSATSATSATNATNAASATNATNLAGQPAAYYSSRVSVATTTFNDPFTPTFASIGDYLQTTLTVPGTAKQYVLVEGQATWSDTSGQCPCNINSQVVQDGTVGTIDYYNTGSASQNVVTSHYVFVAAPGTHTYKFQVGVFQATSNVNFYDGILTAQTIPAGGTGLSPTLAKSAPRGVRATTNGAPPVH